MKFGDENNVLMLVMAECQSNLWGIAFKAKTKSAAAYISDEIFTLYAIASWGSRHNTIC